MNFILVVQYAKKDWSLCWMLQEKCPTPLKPGGWHLANVEHLWRTFSQVFWSSKQALREQGSTISNTTPEGQSKKREKHAQKILEQLESWKKKKSETRTHS